METGSVILTCRNKTGSRYVVQQPWIQIFRWNLVCTECRIYGRN